MRSNLDSKKDDERKLDRLFNSFQFIIAQKILAARLRQGITREQVSKKLNMNESEYADIEHGQNFQMTEEEYKEILNKVSNIRNSRSIAKMKGREFSFKNIGETYNNVTNFKVRIKTNVNSIQPEWV